MDGLVTWKKLLKQLGVATQAIPGRSDMLQLTNVAGCPVFRVVSNLEELQELHTRARTKSSEMERLLVLALPLNHPNALMTLPGEIHLPKVRVYGGHIADTFSLHGHLIESTFLKAIKKEVLAVMNNGKSAKTPLCDWVQSLLGSAWKYGTPSTLVQLDSMLGLITNDTIRLGHVRARQLTFGRGCADATILPIAGTTLRNNSINQSVMVPDIRFVSLEQEMTMTDTARMRVHPVFCNAFLSVLSEDDPDYARKLGAGLGVGASTLGTAPARRVKIQTSAPTSADQNESVFA